MTDAARKPEESWCAACGGYRPIGEFYPRADGGVQAYCIAHSKAAVNDWRRKRAAERALIENQRDPEQPIVIRPVDFACKADLARRTGMTKDKIHYLVHNDERFPTPIARLGDKRGIPVWDFREIEAYIAKTIDKRRTNV